MRNHDRPAHRQQVGHQELLAKDHQQISNRPDGVRRPSRLPARVLQRIGQSKHPVPMLTATHPTNQPHNLRPIPPSLRHDRDLPAAAPDPGHRQQETSLPATNLLLRHILLRPHVRLLLHNPDRIHPGYFVPTAP